jgi:hypothetical protein
MIGHTTCYFSTCGPENQPKIMGVASAIKMSGTHDLTII